MDYGKNRNTTNNVVSHFLHALRSKIQVLSNWFERCIFSSLNNEEKILCTFWSYLSNFNKGGPKHHAELGV